MKKQSVITMRLWMLILLISVAGCSSVKQPVNPQLKNKPYSPNLHDKTISRDTYYNKLQGFWLATCIANWTGLVTEMDKIGNIGEIKTGDFYTRDDWGKPDQPSI